MLMRTLSIWVSWVILLNNVLCAKLVALVDDGLDVHDAGADFAEILVVGTLAEAVPRDEHVRVADCPQVDRGIGGLRKSPSGE